MGLYRQDRSHQAEELDFKAGLKNRIMYLSLYRMCLLEVCGKRLFVNHPAMAFFLSRARGGEEGFRGSGVAVVSTTVLRGGNHLACFSQPGSGLRLRGVQLAAAGCQEPENWLLPQGGLGDAGEWRCAAGGLSAKLGSGSSGLTL